MSELWWVFCWTFGVIALLVFTLIRLRNTKWISKEFFREVVAGALVALLSFWSAYGLYLFQEHRKALHMHEVRCRQLREELRYNTFLLQTGELVGRSPDFRLESWYQFAGSDSFYRLPDDIKRTLSSFHNYLRLQNDGFLKVTKRDKLKEGDLSSQDMIAMLGPFLHYLVQNRIISLNDATLQWSLNENGMPGIAQP
mgnify:CR=1 FL=1